MFDFADLLQLKTGMRRILRRGKDGPLRLILVSADEELGLSVRNAASFCRLEMFRTRTVGETLQLLVGMVPCLVIYDRVLEEEDWRVAVDLLTADPSHPCVLLASRAADSYLWEELLRHGGFDVVPRSASVECLTEHIKFARFSLRRSALS
jgi:hypothetical protein